MLESRSDSAPPLEARVGAVLNGGAGGLRRTELVGFHP